MIHRLIAIALLSTLATIAATAKEFEYEKESGVVFHAPNGNELRMDYWQPTLAEDERRPAVLLIHGGAWIAGSRRQMGWYGRHLAENGYFAASTEYRLLPKTGFPSCLYDVKESLRWLRRNADRFNIDPDRIAVMGESAGAHLAGMIANTDPEDGLEGPFGKESERTDVQAAIIVYGAVDLRPYAEMAKRDGFYFGKNIVRMLDRFVTMEQPNVDQPYHRASPIIYIDADTPPTIMFHGTNDSLVPIDHARNYFDALSEAGVAARLVEFEGQNHGFDHVRWGLRRALFEDILIFLEQHLDAKGVE